MRRGLGLRNNRITKLQDRARGYILISLMLFMALLAIAALAVFPKMKFQAERDREEEMVHRGVAYERGIRRFYRKFGRYPMRIEDLENTNNLRFIRKHYTDPVNIVEGKEQEFKVLHMADVHLSIGTGPSVGVPVNGAPGVTLPPQQTQQGQPATTPDSGNPGSGAAISVTPQTGADTSDTSSSSSSAEPSSSGFNGPTFGGGPILGVVSASKKKSIREFCNKSHYKDWLFVYDPTQDRGGTLNSPWCPLAVPTGAGLNQPGIGPAQPNAGPQPQVQPSPGGPSGTPPAQSNPGGNMPPEQ
jgi:type II secretory pathway pseudopilin PulG